MTQGMSSDLAHAIHAFHDGGLSQAELFAQVDHLLSSREADPRRLLDTLGDDGIRRMLPPQVHAQLRGRIEQSARSAAAVNGDETRVMTSPGARITYPTAPSDGFHGAAGTDIEKIKGVGDTLNGRFVLEECIGFGGMGTVYKALDLRKLEASDRKPYIAIKVLNVQFRGHPKSLIALQREARKAQTLAHPNIVTVYDFDRDGSTVFLTMELLSGKPLSQILRTQGFSGLPYAEAMRIVTGIAKGLEYAHERGFVHCDLKPANVFMTDKGEVKVIDFGIARVFRKPEEEMEATVFDPGSLGAMTPAYASPEMQEHREPDPRDDIYALACITYELLSGRHPFDRLSALQARGAGMKPPRPKKLGHRQWRAIRCALAFERESRTPTVARFMEDMSGNPRTKAYLTLAGSSLMLAMLFAAAITYFKDYHAGRRAQQSSGDAPAEQAEPVPPPVVEKREEPKKEEPKKEAPVLSMAAVAPVLGQVPCSALAASVQGATLRVQGYLPKSYGAARLKKSLDQLPGAEVVNLQVQQVNQDECAVIEAFAPYWIRNHQAGRPASIRSRAANAELTEGDSLILEITTPPWHSFVYIDYHVLDGSVVHMVPSPRATANQAPANYAATIGGLGNWVVSKPFGNEMIVLISAPAPLFAGMRPEVEPRAEYLRDLRKQLEQMTAKHGAEKIGVDFVRIATRARRK